MKKVTVVGCVWVRDGKLLASRRPQGKRLAGLYEFPGGKLEPGETDLEALDRELMEELGVKTTVLSKWKETVHVYSFGQVTLHLYQVESDEEPKSMEGQGLKWLTRSELDPSEWVGADEYFIREMIEENPFDLQD